MPTPNIIHNRFFFERVALSFFCCCFLLAIIMMMIHIEWESKTKQKKAEASSSAFFVVVVVLTNFVTCSWIVFRYSVVLVVIIDCVVVFSMKNYLFFENQTKTEKSSVYWTQLSHLFFNCCCSVFFLGPWTLIRK